MNLILESSARFRFLDYHISHTQLLIRGAHAIDGQNLDIIFEGVDFLNCPTAFTGIKLYLLDNDSSAAKKLTLKPFIKNFLIESEKNEYFIQAGVLRIFKNTLSPLETSIDMTGKGQENLVWISR